MKWYKNLSYNYKLLLLGFCLVVLYLNLTLIPSNSDNTLLQISGFVFIFISLYLIFNISDLKIYNKIFIGLALGILAGLFFGEQIQVFQPVGKAFIKLIKMIVIPLVFSSILVGTASMNNIKRLGKIGVRTFAFYIISTALAITIGLIIANTIKPGSNIPKEIQSELRNKYEQEAGDKISKATGRPSTIDLFLILFPRIQSDQWLITKCFKLSFLP